MCLNAVALPAPGMSRNQSHVDVFIVLHSIITPSLIASPIILNPSTVYFATIVTAQPWADLHTILDYCHLKDTN